MSFTWRIFLISEIINSSISFVTTSVPKLRIFVWTNLKQLLRVASSPVKIWLNIPANVPLASYCKRDNRKQLTFGGLSRLMRFLGKSITPEKRLGGWTCCSFTWKELEVDRKEAKTMRRERVVDVNHTTINSLVLDFWGFDQWSQIKPKIKL